MRRIGTIIGILGLGVFGSSGGDWPMARGAPDLRGLAGGRLADVPQLLWTFRTTNAIKSSAAIAGGRVFIGSDDGHLYALDAATGRKLWAFRTGEAIEATPLVLDGAVYFGDSAGELRALDAVSGAQKWSYKTEDKILGGANWFRSTNGADRIVVGSYDFKVHCVDAASGKAVWTFETSNYVNGTPAVAGGRIIFGGCDGKLHALDSESGRQIAEIEAGAYVAGSPALAGSRAFAGHFGEEVVCVEVATSNIAWRTRQSGSPFFSSPAVTEKLVVIGGRDNRLHAYERETGKPAWAFATRGDVDGSPVVSGDQVVVGCADGRLYIVNLADGKQLWSYDAGKELTSSPAVANGMIVIGSEDGSVYAFGSPTRK